MIKKENKDMLLEVFYLVEKIQFIVNKSLDKINEDSSVAPVDFSEGLKEISTYVQQLGQIIHQT